MMKQCIELRQDFYHIHNNADGTVDIYLHPGNGCGSIRNDIAVRVVKGVEPFGTLEEDIRRRYGDWYDSGEII